MEIARHITASHREAAESSDNADYQRFWRRSEKAIFRDMEGKLLVGTVPEKYHQYLPFLDNFLGALAGVEAFRGKRASVTGDKYINSTQLARRLGIGASTLSRWVKAGKPPKPERGISETMLFERATADRLNRSRLCRSHCVFISH